MIWLVCEISYHCIDSMYIFVTHARCDAVIKTSEWNSD